MPFRLDPNQSPTTPQAHTGFRPEKKSLQGFINNNNVGSSGLNLAKGIGESAINVLNPDLEKNTLVNLGRTIYDAGGAIAGDKSKTNKFNQIADFYKTRYGGLENIGNTLYNDPVGAVMDVSMIAGGVGGLAKAGGLADVANVAGKVSEFTNPLNVVTKPLGWAKGKAAPMIADAGKTLEAGGEGVLTHGLGNPAKQADIVNRSGQSIGGLIKKYNLFERNPEVAQIAREDVMGKYDAIALKSGNKVNLGKVIKSMDKAIEELSSGGNQYSDSAKAQIQELLKRKAQVIDMAGGTTPAGTGVMMKNPNSIEAKIADLTEYRRSLDKDIPNSQFITESGGLGKAEGTKMIRDILREHINASDPRLKQLGLDYGALKGLKKVFEGYQSRLANRQVFPLKKVVASGLGGQLGGFPGAVAGYAADSFFNSPQFLKGASEILDKASGVTKNLRKMKMPKTNVFSNASRITKAGYATNPKRNQ